MKALGLTSEMSSPSVSALKAYEEMYSGDPAYMQALRELFPADGEVGTCKQRHYRSAARA
jgi:hypothetical protein